MVNALLSLAARLLTLPRGSCAVVAVVVVMIVRQFLQWMRTAPPASGPKPPARWRAPISIPICPPDDRAAAEGAMIMLLDDPSPLVRRALAEVFAASADAPPAVVHALAGDQPDIAAPVLERSPLLLDADLVDAVATGEPERAGRRSPAARVLPCAVSAAIAEVGSRRSLPGAARESRRRNRAVLARPHRRALRPSRRHPRGAAGARRSAGADASGAGGQAVARRSPASSPRAHGWARTAPRASPRRPARRRPSRSPPIRRTARCAR